MMQKRVITATPAMSLAEVQRLMRDHHIRHVPVVSGKRLVGMITDRDIREASPSPRSEEHTSELQSRQYLVCRLLLEKKKTKQYRRPHPAGGEGPTPTRRPWGPVLLRLPGLRVDRRPTQTGLPTQRQQDAQPPLLILV